MTRVSDRRNSLQDKINEVFARDIIRIEAVGHMRGRSSLKNGYYWWGAKLNAKSDKDFINTFSGATKLVLMGDPAQIDHHLDTVQMDWV